MARVRLYSNTGFNGVDIPEDLSLLTHGDHEIMEYEDMNIQSCEGLTSIKVRISTGDALEVDYIWVRDNDNNDCLYVNMGSRPIAHNTYEFILEPNALSTILEDITVISAVAERMHVDDDDTTFYPNLEPFEQSEPSGVAQTTMHPNFPNRGFPDCIELLETVTLPPEDRQLPNNTVIDGNNKVTQKVYGPTQQFANTTGPEYEYTTPQVFTITDSNGNITSQSVMGTMQPHFATGTHTIYNVGAYGTGLEAAQIDTGSYWIAGASAIQPIVNKLKALGADSSVANHWAVPTVYTNNPSAGLLSQISNSVFIHQFEWGLAGYGPGGQPIYLNPKNNKVIYGQAITGTTYSPISGASITKQGWEVRNPDQVPNPHSLICSYAIGADLRPEGSPNFHWINRNGLEQVGFPEVIEGGSWRRLPIGADTYSGSEWDRRSLAVQKDILNLPRWQTESMGAAYSGNDMMASVMGSISDFIGFASKNFGAGKWMNNSQATTNYANSPIGNLPSGYKGTFGLSLGALNSNVMNGMNWSQANYALMRQEQELNARASVATTVINTSTSNYLRELGYNTFYMTVCSYSANDIQAFDTFLTKYGYNVGNKKFLSTDFYSRSHFNYVKLKSIIMKTDRSMWMRNIAEQQLLRGVRIWHEYPSRGAIEDGNP